MRRENLTVGYFVFLNSVILFMHRIPRVDVTIV